jgi:hypothetical protein
MSENDISEVAGLVRSELEDENGSMECEISDEEADYKLKLTNEELEFLNTALSLSLTRFRAEGDGDTLMARSILEIKNRLRYTELEEL